MLHQYIDIVQGHTSSNIMKPVELKKKAEEPEKEKTENKEVLIPWLSGSIFRRSVWVIWVSGALSSRTRREEANLEDHSQSVLMVFVPRGEEAVLQLIT